MKWNIYRSLNILGVRMVQENFTLTEDMKFGEAHTISIIAYSLMFLIGIITNSKSLYTLLDERINKRDRSKMTLLLIHLAVADLTVRLLMKRCTMNSQLYKNSLLLIIWDK